MRYIFLLLIGLFLISPIAQAQEPGQKEKPSRIGKLLGKADTLIKKVGEKVNSQTNTIQILSPRNNATISKKERQSGILFKWSEVKTEVNEPVSYRLKIWHAKNSQELKQAVLGKPSFQFETLERVYSTGVICDTTDNPCECPACPDKIYAWGVEASQNGKLIATSVLGYYSASEAGCGTNKATVNIICGKIIEGRQSYNVTVFFSNIVPTSGGQQCSTKMTGINSPTGTVSAITTLPVTLAAGGTTASVTFVYIPTNPAATTADFKYTGIWNDPYQNTSIFGTEKFVLPRCGTPANCCENSEWDLKRYGLNTANLNLPASNTHLGSFKCKEKLVFQTGFKCGPNCGEAEIKYEVYQGMVSLASATLSSMQPFSYVVPSNSTLFYTINISALCNGKICKTLSYTFSSDCPQDPPACCKKMTYKESDVRDADGNTVFYFTTNNTFIISPEKQNCNKDYFIRTSINCGIQGCASSTFYTLKRYSNGAITTATNLLPFPATMPNDLYYLTVALVCGKDTCKKLEYTIRKDCSKNPNTCGDWVYKGVFVLADSSSLSGTFDISCGSAKIVKKGEYIYATGARKCLDERGGLGGIATVKTFIYDPNNVLVSQETLGDYNAMDSVLAEKCGRYTIKLVSECGKITCDTCIYYADVVCTTDCCPGKWSKFVDESIGKPISHLTNLGIFKCNEQRKFTFCYGCPEGCGSATIRYEIIKTGSSAVSTTMASNCATTTITFPSISGTYELRVSGLCNGKVCNWLRYPFTVECNQDTDCCKGGKWIPPFIPPPAPTPQNPLNYVVSIPASTCGTTLQNVKCSTYINFRYAYQCATTGNCPATITYVLKNANTNTIINTYANLANSANLAFLTPGTSENYSMTAYAKCGNKVCDSCTVYFKVECTVGGDCCKNSKWLSAQYMKVNKKQDGSWDYSDQTYYTLPLNGGIPLVKADVGITVDNLKFQCNKGCESGFIIRRKNETTGVFEPNEVLSNGKDDCSVYAKTYPQTITIIPTCGGESCGDPIVFRIECLSNDCNPCNLKKAININTGTDTNGGLLAINTPDPFWATAFSRNVVESQWGLNTASQKIIPILKNDEAMGDFSFTRSFNVCQTGDITITGSVLCDNQLRSLQLLGSTANVLWSAPSVPTANDNIYGPPSSDNYDFFTSLPLPVGQYRIVATYRNRRSSEGNATAGWFELKGTISTANGGVANTAEECCSSSSTGSTANSDTVNICGQTWMKKNLDVTTYRNGDPIPQIQNLSQWATATTGAWCYYNNDPALGAIYGKLYNWYAVNDPRGLAPLGWHIPMNAEWQTLVNCLGGDVVAGGKMKETGTSLWSSPNNSATNSSGFCAIPGGQLSTNGSGGVMFSLINNSTMWWSTTQNNSTTTWCRYINSSMGIVGNGYTEKYMGNYIRCVKN
jgi:uncharacterized protein (TIGR02145 family)